MSELPARYGWQSDLPTFVKATPEAIERALVQFLAQPSGEQRASWQRCIRWLQREYDHCIRERSEASTYSTILEYELPRDFRRPDIIVLEGGGVVVLEVKGRAGASAAARDQVAAYARDLAAYHAACAGRTIVPVVVPSDGTSVSRRVDGVWVVGPTGIHEFLLDQAQGLTGPPVAPADFLSEDAYAPLPTIVQAARALYHGRALPYIKRARANTEPALESITGIAHEAARTRTRRLVLLSGVPGSGKTLVGLQLVHSGWLDDLAVERQGRKLSPAVYLSGNGPLVAVLQDALRGGEVPGSTFVQDIKKYVAYYSRKAGRAPSEHLIVFDEAQRAHDAARVATVHGQPVGASEPELLLDFCARIPQWCVLVALIGEGQAIHAGEEGGICLWSEAIGKRASSEGWIVHAGPALTPYFARGRAGAIAHGELNLDVELRFHLTPKVHEFVAALLDGGVADELQALATELHDGGHRFLITQSLEVAKSYLRERYGEAPQARYGLMASSKDRILPDFGVDNTFQTTKRLRVGPWYNQPVEHPLSCCRLETVATEFSSQGLELDAALVAWGSDLIRERGVWTNRLSRGTRGSLRDPLQLRKNVYRVLLTRGRDGSVIYVPDHADLRETWAFLRACGIRELDA